MTASMCTLGPSGILFHPLPNPHTSSVHMVHWIPQGYLIIKFTMLSLGYVSRPDPEGWFGE